MAGSTNFEITWRDGAYYVSIPNYKGGTVYTAAEHYRLTRENKALRKALEPVAALAYYINNPSAWEHFDDEMSERLRPIVEAAAIALKEPGQ